MKIVTLKKDNTPSLYEFIKNAKNFPFKTVRDDTGYGVLYPVVTKWKLFGYNTGDIIAKINCCYIELYYPEYFSDFENLCKEYENKFNKEVTLKYWE